MNMVAGSTTSAIRAVSVMNCSCTQTNRSSRAKPRLTLSCSGATDTGLVFWISSAVTGYLLDSASGSPTRIAPMRDWSSMRTERSTHVEPLGHGLVPVIDRAVVVEGAAAFQRQEPRHRRDAARGVHVGRAVARARETVAEAEIGALALGDQRGECLDGLDRSSR